MRPSILISRSKYLFFIECWSLEHNVLYFVVDLRIIQMNESPQNNVLLITEVISYIWPSRSNTLCVYDHPKPKYILGWPCSDRFNTTMYVVYPFGSCPILCTATGSFHLEAPYLINILLSQKWYRSTTLTHSSSGYFGFNRKTQYNSLMQKRWVFFIELDFLFFEVPFF